MPEVRGWKRHTSKVSSTDIANATQSNCAVSPQRASFCFLLCDDAYKSLISLYLEQQLMKPRVYLVNCLAIKMLTGELGIRLIDTQLESSFFFEIDSLEISMQTK